MKKSVGERIVRVRSKMMTTTILRENKEKRMVCFSCADDEMECATNAVMRNNDDDDDDDDDGERRASSSLCSSSFSSLSSSGEEKEDTMNFEKGISKKMMTTFMDRIEMNKTLILSSFMLPLGVTLAPNFDLEGPGSVIQALSVLATIIFVHESGHFLACEDARHTREQICSRVWTECIFVSRG